MDKNKFKSALHPMATIKSSDIVDGDYIRTIEHVKGYGDHKGFNITLYYTLDGVLIGSEMWYKYLVGMLEIERFYALFEEAYDDDEENIDRLNGKRACVGSTEDGVFYAWGPMEDPFVLARVTESQLIEPGCPSYYPKDPTEGVIRLYQEALLTQDDSGVGLLVNGFAKEKHAIVLSADKPVVISHTPPMVDAEGKITEQKDETGIERVHMTAPRGEGTVTLGDEKEQLLEHAFRIALELYTEYL